MYNMITEAQYEELIRAIYGSIKAHKKSREDQCNNVLSGGYDEALFNFYDGKVIALENVIDYITLNFEK